MSEKKYKKMNNKHKNRCEVSTRKPTGFELGEVCPDLLEYMMTNPERFKEIKQKDGEWVEIPGAEITFPVAGNLFYVKLLQYGDDAAEIVTDFSECLFDRYAAREFHVSGERMVIFAVDALVADVKLIWETIIRMYGWRG